MTLEIERVYWSKMDISNAMNSWMVFQVGFTVLQALENDPKMFKQLEIYDIVGPVIANIINGDKEVAIELFESSISPVCIDIINGNYNSALMKYTYMTKRLINKYKDSVSIGLDVFKMSDNIGQVKYGTQYKKCLDFGEKFRRY